MEMKDKMEHMNKTQRIQSISLKLVTKILLPFSLLSAILSYPLLFNFQTLAYSLQLFSFSVGKNYMFLLCNGLLVFIATSSGLIGGFGVESDLNSDKAPRNIKGEVASSEPKVSILKAEVDQREDLPFVAEEDEGEEERSNELVSMEEDEDGEVGLMSHDELNKKCEDFIRRMKKGIAFEAGN